MRADRAPFDFSGDDRGVLCLHGFTATPFEMRYLGERLHERGYTVVGPLLPGHDDRPEALNRTRWTAWYRTAEAALDELRRRCARVAVVGQSLGGLLALHLARTRGEEVTALAALATPLWLSPLGRAVVAAYRHTRLGDALPVIPKLGGSDIRDPVMKRKHASYPVFPGRALVELDDLMTLVRRQLPAIRPPALIMHGKRDHTAPFACSRELVRRYGGPAVHRTLQGSYHLISLDIERDLVANEVGRFFDEHCGERTNR